MKVRLVLKDRGWILEKIAKRLAEYLPRWNVKAEIDQFPSSSVDVNHWMLYYDTGGKFVSKNTLGITHVDRRAKLHVLKRRLESADMGICMSRMMVEQLVALGAPRDKLCFISPAHDGLVKPKRIVVGITTQIRPDGAKRESILVEVAKKTHLGNFHFEIIGPNWQRVIPILKAAGATVNYNEGHYTKSNESHLALVVDALTRFDYYLYMGWDEGSMGILDALAAGIPTIATPQGFHLDIESGITHPFIDSKDLHEIFMRLGNERQSRIDGVKHLTWDEYARKHAAVWHAIVGGERSPTDSAIHEGVTFGTDLPEKSGTDWRENWSRMRTRTNNTALKDDFAMLWEFYTGKKLRENRFFKFAKRLKSMLQSDEHILGN